MEEIAYGTDRLRSEEIEVTQFSTSLANSCRTSHGCMALSAIADEIGFSLSTVTRRTGENSSCFQCSPSATIASLKMFLLPHKCAWSALTETPIASAITAAPWRFHAAISSEYAATEPRQLSNATPSSTAEFGVSCI
jgi:hypothetical protein